MAKGESNVSDVDQTLSLGSQAWNVADGYTKIKILKHLVQLDRYENIALFGSDDMEDFEFDNNFIAKRRDEALRRMVTTLRQLIGNVQFALKAKDKKEINSYGERVAFVGNLLDGISFTEENQITKESYLRINEPHFSKCIKVLQRVKDEINFPINNAGLIFRGSDEIDLDKIQSEIIKGG